MNLPNEESNSLSLDLESLNLEYKNLLIEYKQSVLNYVNYLKQENDLPCGKYNLDSIGIDQKCYDEVWRKAGCSTSSSNSSDSWISQQKLSDLILDSFYWATMTDYDHRKGCYGSSGSSYIIIGVGDDGNLYSREGLHAPWIKINDNSDSSVTAICTMSDGNQLLGIKEQNLYKKTDYLSNWTGPIVNSCCVKSIAHGQDGTSVGVGMDNKLWSKANLEGVWERSNSASGEYLSSICIAPDGSIFGVGSDLMIYKKDSYKNLPSQQWKQIGSTCCVIAITVAPDGTLIGIGTDRSLYTKANYKDLTTPWQGPYNQQNLSCCVIGITTILNSNYDASLYNTQIEPDYDINKEQLVTLKGKGFWGDTSIAVNNLPTLQDCQASCSSTKGCTGATFNKNDHSEPICSLRGGDGNIVNGLPDDYAIIPKGKLLLTTVNDINEKLARINQQILSKIKNSKSIYNENSQKNILKNNELKEQYKQLILDRNNIRKIINEYQTLDQKQVEGNIIINKNYYSFLLLMGLVIAIIFILYKFSGPIKQQTNTLIQSGGYVSSNTSYIIFGIILFIFAIYFYNKK